MKEEQDMSKNISRRDFLKGSAAGAAAMAAAGVLSGFGEGGGGEAHRHRGGEGFRHLRRYGPARGWSRP